MNCPACGKNHHGLCHQCPHAKDVADGKYLDTDFARCPCSSCIGLQTDSRIRHISGHPDSIAEDGGQVVDISPLENVLSAPEQAAYFVHRNVVLHMLKLLLEMPTLERETVFHRLNGKTYPEIKTQLFVAFGRSISVQAIHKCLLKATASNDILRELFRTTEEKQKRRKKREQNSA